MEAKIVKTILVLILLIVILTILAHYFSILSSTWGQAALVAGMLASIFTAYKLIRIIYKTR